MKISQKLFLFLSVIALFLFGFGGYFYYEIQNIRRAGNQFSKEWNELSSLQSFQNTLGIVLQALPTEGRKDLNSNGNHLPDNFLETFESKLRNISSFQHTGISHDRKHQMREIELQQQIQTNGRDLVETVKLLSRNPSPTTIPDQASIEKIEAINHSINEFIQEDRNYVQASLETLRRIQTRVPRRMTILGIFMFATLLLYGLYLYRSLVHSINSIRDAIHSVAETDFKHQIEYDREDELGEIARDFNRMIEKLNEAWDTMEQKVEQKTKELLLKEKLSTVGEMASRMAHELNTPLATISTAAEGIENRLEEPDEQLEEYTEILQKESYHCKDIIDRFLTMVRSPEEEMKSLQLDQLCRNTVSMLHYLPEFKNRSIEITQNLENVTVEGNQSLLRQVILNLLKNAIHAVSKVDSHTHEPQITVVVTESNGSAQVQVIDNGIGFSPEQKSKFFEPFVSSHTGDGGLGLGLSISRQIVNDHGGQLELESDGPGKGCRAIIFLPSLDPETETA